MSNQAIEIFYSFFDRLRVIAPYQTVICDFDLASKCAGIKQALMRRVLRPILSTRETKQQIHIQNK